MCNYSNKRKTKKNKKKNTCKMSVECYFFHLAWMIFISRKRERKSNKSVLAYLNPRDV